MPIKSQMRRHFLKLRPVMRWQILHLIIDKVGPSILLDLNNPLQLAYIRINALPEDDTSLHFFQRSFVGFRQY